MTHVLFIGGSNPEKVMRLTFAHESITVICTSEAQRRENWQFRAMPGVTVMVADPLAITPEIQPKFDRTFDAVYINVSNPALTQKAWEFVTKTGKVMTI